MTDNEPAQDLNSTAAREKRMQRLAWLMDESIRLPGGFRIGLDGLLGLIPGLGDMSGALIGSYIVYEARAVGAPRRLLARMGANLAIEAVIGSIPLVGDLFDFYYKANLRNIRLLNKYHQQQAASSRYR